MNETPERLDHWIISGNLMGKDLLGALLSELRTMPDHWSRINETTQQKIIDRLREKIKIAVDGAQHRLLATEFAAVHATLDGVKFGGSIHATITVPRDAAHRHAFADATGRKVLVIMASADQWVARMDEVKAKSAQDDLFDRDYDPSIDQPGYRRDQDRIAPAGSSWEELKKGLTSGSESKPEETPADESPAPSIPSEPAALLERLLKIHCEVGAEEVAGWTQQQCIATMQWLDVFEQFKDEQLQCPVARPLWVPIPNPPIEPGAGASE